MTTNDKLKARYFSHDCNARNDEKLIALRMDLGAAGYGIYFMLLERCGESTNYACANDCKLIAFELREDPNIIKKVIEEYGLFEFTEGKKRFFSQSFNRRMKFKDRDSINGIKGNLIKYGYASKEQLEKMSTDEILAFNEKVKSIKRDEKPGINLGGDSGANSGGDRNKVKEEKEANEKKEKERKRDSAFNYLAVTFPDEYQKYVCEYGPRIGKNQQQRLITKFDNKVKQEDLEFDEKLLYRLINFTESWISNKNRFPNSAHC